MAQNQLRVAGLVIAMATLTYFLAENYLSKALRAGNPVIYIVVLYAAIWAFLAWLTHCRAKPSMLATISAAAVLGHLVAMLTSFAIHVAQPSGVERLSNSVQQFGSLDAVLIYLVFPLLLGGWLLAPIAAVICLLTIKPNRHRDSLTA